MPFILQLQTPCVYWKHTNLAAENNSPELTYVFNKLEQKGIRTIGSQ